MERETGGCEKKEYDQMRQEREQRLGQEGEDEIIGLRRGSRNEVRDRDCRMMVCVW